MSGLGCPWRLGHQLPIRRGWMHGDGLGRGGPVASAQAVRSGSRHPCGVPSIRSCRTSVEYRRTLVGPFGSGRWRRLRPRSPIPAPPSDAGSGSAQYESATFILCTALGSGISLGPGDPVGSKSGTWPAERPVAAELWRRRSARRSLALRAYSHPVPPSGIRPSRQEPSGPPGRRHLQVRRRRQLDPDGRGQSPGCGVADG